MKYTLLMVFVSINILCHAQETYKKFTANQQFFEVADELANKNRWEEALVMFKKCTKMVTLRGCNIDIARCYYHLGKKNKGLKYISKSFSKGYELDVLSIDRIFSSDIERIKKKYSTYHKKFIQNIDSNTVKLLNDIREKDQYYRNSINYTMPKNKSDSLWKLQTKFDSINTYNLKNYIQVNGWPSIEKYGYEFILSPDIVAVHGNESDCVFFFNESLKSTQKGKNDWFSVRSIMFNLLWRFQFTNNQNNTSGFNKLRYTYFDKNYKILREKSFFQLKSLVELNINNPRDIEIFLCFSEPSKGGYYKEISKYVLNDLTSYLKDLGFTNSILVNENPLQITKDNLGDFLIGYRNIKKN